MRAALAPLLGAGWTFDVQGFGETRPIAANEKNDGSRTPRGARTRRVEIAVLS